MALAAALASALTEARATMAASVVHEENFFDDAFQQNGAVRRPSVIDATPKRTPSTHENDVACERRREHHRSEGHVLEGQVGLERRQPALPYPR